MSVSKFINPEEWKNIERGYYYQAAMYYLSNTMQPLRFLERINDGETYKINTRTGNFDAVNGRAVEQDIVVTLKPRQVIVLSNDRLNQNKGFEYVQILPIFSLKHSDSVNSWYDNLKKDLHPGFVYIPRGRYGLAVDLTQVSTIHKSLLLKKQTKVPKDRMNFIDSQALELLDL